MKKVYIMLNNRLGWKVIEDHYRHIDCTTPLIILKTLDEAQMYCNNNDLKVIRVCQ